MSKNIVEVDTKTIIRFWLVLLAILLVIFFFYKASAALIIIGISIFLAIALKPLDGSLNLGAECEVVDGRCQHQHLGFGQQRIEFLHVVFLDTGAIAFRVAILTG